MASDAEATPGPDVASAPSLGRPVPADPEPLPFDEVDLHELEGHARAAPSFERETAPAPVMNPSGVDDPFPDRPPRIHVRSFAVPLSVSLGLAAAGTVMARLALLPDCENENDVSTCDIPDNGDIGVRGGRLVGATAFGVGGAVFGALAGRELGNWLTQTSRFDLRQKRRIAIGTGTTAVVLGTAGMVAGATLFGLATSRSIELARTFDSVSGDLTDEEEARLGRAVGHVKTARAGLMVLVAAPTVFATGVALLRHRPRRPRLSLSPAITTTHFGVTAKLRF